MTKTILAFCLSIFVICGLCVTTIEGEIRDGNLVGNSVYDKESKNSGDIEPVIQTSTVSPSIITNIRSDISKSVDDSRSDERMVCDSNVNSSANSTVGYCDGRSESNDGYSEVVSRNSASDESTNSGTSNGVTGNTNWEEGNGIEGMIFEACARHGIDSSIVLAIARLETGNFTSYAYIVGNNPGGMSVNETPIIYSSLEAGVEAMVSNLANNYFAIGLTTPELIGTKYCPVNPSWASHVRSLMY